MADYAIGLSFHKAHRTIVRAVPLTAPCRYYATRDTAGAVTLPTLDAGSSYVELQGITQTSFQINDNNQEFRLLGDDGWADSVITGSTVQASVTSYFLKDAEVPSGQNCPVFRGNYDEGFSLIQRARYDKEFEIYIEFLKELGQAEGSTGNFIYDYTGFNAVLQNYQESMSAEGLTEITFDLVSRSRPTFGRYDAGATRIAFGAVQSSLLFLTAGTRQAGVVPADNSMAVVVTADPTVTYTSNGTIALTNLALGQTEGSGFSLHVASTGVRVPATVSLSNNVVTISPLADLQAATMYRLTVADGAITQSVNAAGVASASGIKRPIQGFRSFFRTA